MFAKETESIECVYTEVVYYKEPAHTIMEAGKSKIAV